MIRAAVTDIEGTTSSLSFVHDVLFPYAEENLIDFVYKQYVHNEVVAGQVRLVASAINVREDDLDAVCAQLTEWMRLDSKATPLKTLQGLVWRAGYKQGLFKGHVYSDVAEALRNWQSMGVDVYVYSSGSVEAQQLLFGYSVAGNLTHLFKGYFDTRVGPKNAAVSYTHIAEKIGLPADEILFLSDTPAELSAAHGVGMRVIQLVREKVGQRQDEFPQVCNFNDIDLERF